MGLIERKKLHKMNRKEYLKSLRIVFKFSSEGKNALSLHNIFDDIFKGFR